MGILIVEASLVGGCCLSLACGMRVQMCLTYYFIIDEIIKCGFHAYSDTQVTHTRLLSYL